MSQKAVLVLALLFLASIACFAQGSSGTLFSATIVPVTQVVPDELFESFGTRSAQFQYFILNNDSESSTAIILKGWLFSPEENDHKVTTEIEISGGNYTLHHSARLVRDGAYMRLEPVLLILPPDTRRISFFGLELNLDDDEEEISMDYEVMEPRRIPRRFVDGLDIFREVDGDLLQERKFLVGESVLIGVFGGERPTGGYSLKVDSVVKSGNEILISAVLIAPSRDAFVTQAFTYPAMVINVPLDVDPGEYKIVLTLETTREEELLSRSEHTGVISVSDQ